MPDRSIREAVLHQDVERIAHNEDPPDPQRPAFHFTAPRNWLNDPNGLIQWEGTYHLFYQHDPDSPLHGLMHWGHARSTDLVHWQHEPVAIAPTRDSADEDGVFSGCAVDDNGTPTAIYSGIQGPHQTICLATSDDHLVTWRKDPGNPVIASTPPGLDLLTTPDRTVHYRDPSVWRSGDEWRMIVGSGITGVGGAVLLYRSTDLRNWEYLHPMLVGDIGQHDPIWTGTMWECPQLIPLGDRHILLISVWHDRQTLYTAHFVGDLHDDGRFTPEHVEIVDPGSFYAPQTFQDDEGRRIMIGWLREQRDREAMAESGWNGAMSIPWVLSLGDDNRVRYTPAPELEALRSDHRRFSDLAVAPGEQTMVPDIAGDCLELSATIEPGTSTSCGLVLRRSPDGAEETRIVFDPTSNALWIDRSRSSLDERADRTPHEAQLDLIAGQPLNLRIFLDRSVLEVAANERTILSERTYPSRPDSIGVGIFAEGGPATFATIDAWTITASM